MRKADPTAGEKLRGAVQLAGSAFAHITRWSHAVHRAISDIPLTRLPAVSAARASVQPTRVLHDGITDGVYSVVDLTGRVVFGVAEVALKKLEREQRRRRIGGVAIANPAPSRTPPAAPAAPSHAQTVDDLGALVNGLFGDSMAAQRNPLAVRLGFYAEGSRLRLERDALAAAHPEASGRVVVFVHGLCCNERSWGFYAEPDQPDTQPYAQRLTADLGFTAYFARYNTGLHVSQNGRSLARAISRLVAAHPVPVEEIVLIGHSMGGLVSRAACHSGLRSRAAWTELVTHVICLGSPHLGSPLERAVHVATSALGIARVTSPFAEALNLRSRGIQDLRYGYTANEDWRGCDRKHYASRRASIGCLPNARYHFIGTSLGSSSAAILGRAVGDGLVHLSSSTAHELADADTAVLFGVHHVRLLNHPAVYREIRSRVLERSAAT